MSTRRTLALTILVAFLLTIAVPAMAVDKQNPVSPKPICPNGVHAYYVATETEVYFWVSDEDCEVIRSTYSKCAGCYCSDQETEVCTVEHDAHVSSTQKDGATLTQFLHCCHCGHEMGAITKTYLNAYADTPCLNLPIRVMSTYSNRLLWPVPEKPPEQAVFWYKWVMLPMAQLTGTPAPSIKEMNVPRDVYRET